LRIPNISTATTDTGSDTEVIFFTPKLITINNEPLISMHKYNGAEKTDDNSILNKIVNNESTFNNEDTQHIQKTFSHSNRVSDNINNPDASTNSHSFYNNIQNTMTSVQNYDVLSNDNIINENESNILNTKNIVNATPLNNVNHHNISVCTKECEGVENDTNIRLENSIPLFSNTNYINKLKTSKNSSFENEICPNDEHSYVINELDNYEYSLNHIKNNPKLILNQEEDTKMCSTINDNLVVDKSSIVSNSDIVESNLSENIASNSDCKLAKLNMVTTEPYPKYTPTVERVIKKYENKPKKECIVM